MTSVIWVNNSFCSCLWSDIRLIHWNRIILGLLLIRSRFVLQILPDSWENILDFVKSIVHWWILTWVSKSVCLSVTDLLYVFQSRWSLQVFANLISVKNVISWPWLLVSVQLLKTRRPISHTAWLVSARVSQSLRRWGSHLRRLSFSNSRRAKWSFLIYLLRHVVVSVIKLRIISILRVVIFSPCLGSGWNRISINIGVRFSWFIIILLWSNIFTVEITCFHRSRGHLLKR